MSVFGFDTLMSKNFFGKLELESNKIPTVSNDTSITTGSNLFSFFFRLSSRYLNTLYIVFTQIGWELTVFFPIKYKFCWILHINDILVESWKLIQNILYAWRLFDFTFFLLQFIAIFINSRWIILHNILWSFIAMIVKII